MAKAEKYMPLLGYLGHTPPQLDMFSVVMLTFLIKLHRHDPSKLRVLGSKMPIRSLT